MLKPVIILAILAFFVGESTCQRFIQPTYRPPPRRPVLIRVRRSDNEPLWLNQGDIPRVPATGDHPYLPKYIDDINLDPNRRVARSYSTPSASRGGGTHQPSRGRDTGPTHPGYNRRNTRELPPALRPRGYIPVPTIKPNSRPKLPYLPTLPPPRKH